MDLLFKTGRIFYGAAIVATGIQQFFFNEFFQILFPPFQSRGLIYPAYLTAILLIVCGIAIMFGTNKKIYPFTLGFLFVFFFIFFYIPYELFVQPYGSWHLGLWTSALKELAYAGGAFIVAGQIEESVNKPILKSKMQRFPQKLIPFGPILFCITMISFGICHFLYTETVENLVPGWIPMHRFWTYFAGIALIGSGIALILRVQTKLIGNLLGIMIFLWVILLHIPRGIANPVEHNGNEVTSAFSALAFSGIAFMIANCSRIPAFVR
jgi:uncharacterized membrane protein